MRRWNTFVTTRVNLEAVLLSEIRQPHVGHETGATSEQTSKQDTETHRHRRQHGDHQKGRGGR